MALVCFKYKFLMIIVVLLIIIMITIIIRNSFITVFSLFSP